MNRDVLIIPTWAIRDPEWASALELLTTEAMQDKGVLDFVDFERRSIGFHRIAPQVGAWGEGEQLLFYFAWELFNGGDIDYGFVRPSIVEALQVLSDAHWERLIEAFRLRRGV